MQRWHWLLLGSVAGYALLMGTNPVRRSLLDGLRVVRRYPVLWAALGACGFGYALFHLAFGIYLSFVLPEAMASPLQSFRSEFRWDWRWVYGAEDSLWVLPRGAAEPLAREAVGPALDAVAGIFNNLVSTFPLAALAAVLLWINWKGQQGVLWRALRQRFGWLGWLIHLGVLLCAAAAIAKPVLYFRVPPIREELWLQWSPVLAWLAFLFEYVVGVWIQVYLILLAYCWVRGITFTHRHLVEVSIRRFSSVVRWAAVVMVLSSLFIDLPLSLRKFPPFADWLPPAIEAYDHPIALMRLLLDAVLIAFATVQITLTFHSEKLGRSFLDHFRFVGRHGWALAWLIIVAGLHFYAIHFANLLILHGLGQGTAPAVGWRLLFPWLAGGVGAWLLASWVGVYRRAEGRRAQSDALTRF